MWSTGIRLIDKSRLLVAQRVFLHRNVPTLKSRNFTVTTTRASATPLLNNVAASVVNAVPRRGMAAQLYGMNISRSFSTPSPPSTEGDKANAAAGSAGPPPPGGEAADDAAGANQAKTSNAKDIDRFNDDDYDDYEEPKTAGQKVRLYWILFMRLSLLALGLVCVYYTAQELFPGRNSPNSLFSEVFDLLRVNDDVRGTTGEPMTAFGRDFGRNTEGRRNHIDSRKYKAEDGSNRTRVRFNVKGPRAQFQVWAEVSDKMLNTEFVYLIVQDVRTGRVMTIHDNRARLEAQMAENSTAGEGDNVIASLMGTMGLKR